MRGLRPRTPLRNGAGERHAVASHVDRVADSGTPVPTGSSWVEPVAATAPRSASCRPAVLDRPAPRDDVSYPANCTSTSGLLSSHASSSSRRSMRESMADIRRRRSLPSRTGVAIGGHVGLCALLQVEREGGVRQQVRIPRPTPRPARDVDVAVEVGEADFDAASLTGLPSRRRDVDQPIVLERPLNLVIHLVSSLRVIAAPAAMPARTRVEQSHRRVLHRPRATRRPYVSRRSRRKSSRSRKRSPLEGGSEAAGGPPTSSV